MAGIRKLKTMESFAVKSQPFPVGLIVGHHIFDQLPKPLVRGSFPEDARPHGRRHNPERRQEP